MERATHEGHWGSSQFLELLAPEGSTLLQRDEELFVAREFLTEQKLRNYDKKGHQTGGGHPKGKGKETKGKGRDTAKGEKGRWQKKSTAEAEAK